jgi:hypothetical protein
MANRSSAKIDKAIVQLESVRRWTLELPTKFEAAAKGEVADDEYARLLKDDRYIIGNAVLENVEGIVQTMRSMATDAAVKDRQKAVDKLTDMYDSEETETDEEGPVRRFIAPPTSARRRTVAAPNVPITSSTSSTTTESTASTTR